MDAAVQGWASAAGEEATALQAVQRLAGACQPLYRHLFVPISQQPGGTCPTHGCLGLIPASGSMPGLIAAVDRASGSLAGILFLMNIRADVRRLLHEQPAGATALRALDTALRCASHDLSRNKRERRPDRTCRGSSCFFDRSSLAEWFSVGLLDLRRISWRHSSGDLLQKIMQCGAGRLLPAFTKLLSESWGTEHPLTRNCDSVGSHSPGCNLLAESRRLGCCRHEGTRRWSRSRAGRICGGGCTPTAACTPASTRPCRRSPWSSCTPRCGTAPPAPSPRSSTRTSDVRMLAGSSCNVPPENKGETERRSGTVRMLCSVRAACKKPGRAHLYREHDSCGTALFQAPRQKQRRRLSAPPRLCSTPCHPRRKAWPGWTSAISLSRRCVQGR